MASLLYGSQNFSTTLNVGGGINSSQTTGIILTSVSGLDTNGGVLCLDWAEALDTDSAEYIIYTGISGNELTGVTRGQEGLSAKSHSNGATIVSVVSKAHLNRINDKLNGTDTSGITVGTISVASSDVNLATGLNIKVNSADPKRGMYIPAASLFGATTNGAASGQIETSTNKVNAKVLDFDQSTEEYACLNIPAPDFWDLGTVTFQFHWTAASGSGDVIWGAQGLARSNDDALDTAYGTAQEVTDTLTATNDECISSATSAITLSGTPAKGDQLYFRIYRKAANGSDTLSADARLMGVRIKFSIGQYDDQ